MDPVTSSSGSTDNAASTALGTGSESPNTASISSSSAPASAPSALASLEKVAAAASSAAGADKGTPDPKLATAAGTTVQPGQPGANAQATGTGEDASWLAIPEARRNTILENTRTKVEKDTTDRIMGEIGWAKGVQKADVVAAFQFANRVHNTPVQFAVELISEIRQNPALAAQLDQALGTPGTGIPANGVKRTMPKGSLRSEDGKSAYSEDDMQQVLEVFKAQLMEEIGGQIAPLEEHRASLAEREEVTRIIHDSRQEASTVMTEMRALPQWPKPDADGKNSGEVKINTYLVAIPAAVKAKIGSVASLYQAFNTYLQNDVFPTLSSTSEQRVRDDLRRKAAAGTGTARTSGGAPNAETKKPANVAELAAHMARMAGAST